MGGFNPIKVIKDTVNTVTNVGKKALTETFDTVTGMDKEERRTLLYGDPQTPRETPEVTPEVVPDDDTLLRDTRRTRGKRAGQGGTLVGGYGALYRKGGSKSATGE
jgi:hypothetical protein